MTQHRRRLMLPEAPARTYVVGDVHGCLDLFDALEARISVHAAGDGPALLVLVGDLVDRGPNSAGVLDRMQEAPPPGLHRLALAGNHEAMFLDFLDHPRGDAPWLFHGGAETLGSYGLRPDPLRGYNLPTRQLRHMVQATVPESHRLFLETMPVSLRLPGYLICHAGLNPARPLAQQTDQDLMWSDPGALDLAPDAAPAIADMTAHGLKMVHGHVPQFRIGLHDRRIAVDTGVYGSGVLSAVCLRPGHPPEILQVARGASSARSSASWARSA